MLDSLERVCALALFLSELSTSIAIRKIEVLLLAFKCSHEHGKLLVLGGDEAESLAGGGVVHGFGVEVARGGEGIGLHITGAGHGGGSSRDGCNGAGEHAVEV